MEKYYEFFRLATGYENPFEWQAEVADRIINMGRGILVVRAGTGAGKTEAVVLPSLYDGRQVIIVEPFRSIIEDLEERLVNEEEGLSLRRLARALGIPYSLGIDYAGKRLLYVCYPNGKVEEKEPKRIPYGADVILTTMDELVYRVLSAGEGRKTSLYAMLTRLASPLFFFDEVHSYSTETPNPLVTLVNELMSVAKYTSAVVASATLSNALIEHLEALAKLNDLHFYTYPDEGKPIPRRERRYPKKVRISLSSTGVHDIMDHVRELIDKGFNTILVRVITPEDAYDIYSRLNFVLKNGYSLGIVHGRMGILDRREVFKALRKDMREGNKVVLVATPAIEAGVDLDFDACVMELAPWRSLEQTIGRVNRRYEKENNITIIVNTVESTWRILSTKEYLEDTIAVLREFEGGLVNWEEVSSKLRAVDEKYIRGELDVPSLLNMYDSDYARLLAISFFSLYHLEGTMLEYVLALSKKAYETRGYVGVTAWIGTKENRVRIPREIAERRKIEEGKKVPPDLVRRHDYVRPDGTRVIARGVIETVLAVQHK